ncbi:MAG TPA: NAD(P)/FAD-dependent oxidoreductase [Polyangia bacterium]|nr:NAD(P)/FAD-dependent oxidoreductase [Polyangia bacterium]
MTAAGQTDNDIDNNVDVIVIGGGPAGSTAANLLSQAGHRVRLLEKEHFPRFHIGESLLPIDLPIFARLGVQLDPAAFIRKDGAEFIDERSGQSATFLFSEALDGTPKSAYQVERSRFDHVLLQRAAALGADVRQGVAVQEVITDQAGASVLTKDGATHRARFIIDATGQDALLARTNHTVQPLKGFGIAAVFRHYDGIDPAIAAELMATGNIKVLMVPMGWMWLIPLAGRRLSVGIVSQKTGLGPELLASATAESPLIQRLIAGAEATEPRIIRNFSYRNRRAYGTRWACIGDAACFLDPVFSSGVSLAMLSAEFLTDRLGAALREGREADEQLMAAHSKHMEVGYRSFAALIHRFYNHEMVRRLFFVETRGEVMRSGITSVLAGDLWREKENPFQQTLLRSAGHEAWSD